MYYIIVNMYTKIHGGAGQPGDRWTDVPKLLALISRELSSTLPSFGVCVLILQPRHSGNGRQMPLIPEYIMLMCVHNKFVRVQCCVLRGEKMALWAFSLLYCLLFTHKTYVST